MRGKIDSKNALWLAPTVGLDQNESSSLEESSKETVLCIDFSPQSAEAIETHE